MNRDELNDGISKAYGRGLITSNAIVTSGPGSYSSKNYFYKTGSFSFGNYYLQKFIQMTIPVPCGNSSEAALIILNGFEQNFKPNENKINVVKDLLNFGFEQVSMRIKEETIELVKTAHKITLDIAATAGIFLNQPSLTVLCVELLDCFCSAICKSDLPFVQKEGSDKHHSNLFPNHEEESDNGIISLRINYRKEYTNNPEKFEKDIFELFKTKYNLYKEPEAKTSIQPNLQYFASFSEQFRKSMPFLNEQKEKNFIFDMDDTKAEVLWFYLDKKAEFQPKDNAKPPQEDLEFIKAFRKILDMLT